jgi:hypothetical protein
MNYFETSNLEEIAEMYEQEIFEFKQFFLSKAPIYKLFKSRLNKLQVLQDAFDSVISNKESAQDSKAFAISFPEENSNLLDSYKAFQSAKNKVRLLISNELYGTNLIQLVAILIDLEKHNARFWLNETTVDEADSVVVSKEPNPIDILNGINEYLMEGGKTFQELKQYENNPPNVLIQEMKRLSLLFKKF